MQFASNITNLPRHVPDDLRSFPRNLLFYEPHLNPDFNVIHQKQGKFKWLYSAGYMTGIFCPRPSSFVSHKKVWNVKKRL